MLGDSGLSGQSSSGQQVILVSHHSQPDSRAPDNGFSVSALISSALEGRRLLLTVGSLCVCVSRSPRTALREGRRTS